ncbi:MAG: 5-bromo-4-chloroindolyl phosphate hydrolysis family protein [Eubacteriales bacterium]|nr:5-bromo-4-chloroindolyl phosphate hydrolysis family protein [Eubacteriales bacterium]
MGNQEWEDLGDKIQDIIDHAVNEKNFRRMSQEINGVLNRALESGSDVLKGALDGAFGPDKRRGGYTSNPNSGPLEGREPDGDKGEYTYGMPGGGLGGGGRNPEHNARAYETHKSHGYQKPPFGRDQRISREKEKQLPALYASTGGETAKGVLMTIFGGTLTGVTGACLVGFGIAALAGVIPVGAVMGFGIAAAASALLLRNGCVTLGRLKRFKSYKRVLGERTYCNLDKLSRAAGKPLGFVKKDLKAMLQKGWFLEGRLDQQETCLITSDETYQQYEETRRQLLEREKEKEAAQARKEQREAAPPQVQEVLDKGNQYLERIRRSNEAIPGEVISRKISRMELIVEKIFERAEEHPEVIPDLKKLMDYYLPMTVKLLGAYEDMDGQPVQGENIQSSKKEIEDTIDTLNVAFEKLLDSIFADTALDVSSDITVLHTILAQEGLTEDDFAKMK